MWLSCSDPGWNLTCLISMLCAVKYLSSTDLHLEEGEGERLTSAAGGGREKSNAGDDTQGIREEGAGEGGERVITRIGVAPEGPRREAPPHLKA